MSPSLGLLAAVPPVGGSPMFRGPLLGA